MRSQLARGEGALGADGGKEEAFGDRGQGATDACDVFLAEHSENDGRAIVSELFAPGSRQDLGAGGIVSAVDDDSVVPALETRGPIDLRQAMLDRLVGDGDSAAPQSRDGERRVFPLMFTGKPNVVAAVYDRRRLA